MSAAEQHRWDTFWDDRLTPSENKGAELALNGFTNSEIADEMDTDLRTIYALLFKCRSKGVLVWAKRSPQSDFSNADLLRMRDRGLSIEQINARTGISKNSIAVRVCRERLQQGRRLKKPYAQRLPKNLIAEWVSLADGGLSRAQIAKRYGVNRAVVCGAVYRAKQKCGGQAA